MIDTNDLEDAKSQENSNLTKAHLLAFFTIFIWGTTFISTKMLLIDFSPTEILFFRILLGYLALFIANPHFIKYRSKKEEVLFVGAGLCVTLYFILQNTALTYTLASNAGVLVSVAPFFTAILSYFLLDGEPFRKSFFIGFIVAIIGIFLISFNGNYILQLNPLGDIMVILSAATWAFYSVFMKKINGFDYNIIQCTRKIFFYSLIFLIPMLPIFKFQLGLERFTSMPNLLNMLFLGLGASALCFVTWNFALGILGPVKTSVYIYLCPVITIVVSAIVLREEITFVAILGVVFILVGLYLSEKKSVSFYKGGEK